jgi:carnitine 3-dehydrogenase
LDEKRLQVFHCIHANEDNRLLATAEQMLLHVDTHAGQASAADPQVLAKLNTIARAHAALPTPESAGRHVGQRSN